MTKKIKKISAPFLIFLISLYFLPVMVAAEEPPTLVTSTSDVVRILNNVRNIIWVVLTVVVVIMFVWAGITFVTAEGDTNKIQKARNRILYGVIGIFVALLAGGILYLIQNMMSR
jgi:fumarate reductase subunit D